MEPLTAINPNLVQDITKMSIKSNTLNFSDDGIESAWEELNPYRFENGKEVVKEDPYKREEAKSLTMRYWQGLTNFENIGGNPETRVTNDETSFVEGNWITPYLIATGYPSQGKMRDNYWEMVKMLQKAHTVFIVNFMNVSEIGGYGGWFFDSNGMDDKKYVVSVLSPTDQPIYFYHYPNWKDHGEGDRKVIRQIIEQLYDATSPLKQPLIIVNCRAGVGRTGTFANLFHFYKKIKESKKLLKDDFSIKAIVENVKAFRGERGDQQFVQSKAQFFMLCRMVEYYFNEAADKQTTEV